MNWTRPQTLSNKPMVLRLLKVPHTVIISALSFQRKQPDQRTFSNQKINKAGKAASQVVTLWVLRGLMVKMYNTWLQHTLLMLTFVTCHPPPSLPIIPIYIYTVRCPIKSPQNYKQANKQTTKTQPMCHSRRATLLSSLNLLSKFTVSSTRCILHFMYWIFTLNTQYIF